MLVGMEKPANAKVLKMNARLMKRYAWGEAGAIVKPAETHVNAMKALKENTVNVLQTFAQSCRPVSNLNLSRWILKLV